MYSKQDRVILSDYFLQKEGFQETIKRINKHKLKNIVIIGGSHSGFSAAWLLMNGPADVLNNAHVKPTCQLRHVKGTKVHFPDAVFKSIDNCKNCCKCETKTIKCPCICSCCGFFRYQDWGFNFEKLPFWTEGSIKILYREKIRVFYNRV